MVKIEFYPEPESANLKPNDSRTKSKHYFSSFNEDPLLELLLKHKQDFTKLEIKEPVSLEELITENIELKELSYPKREVLGEEFTDEDYEKLCSTLSLQNEQFKKHQMRDVCSKVQRIKSTFTRLTFEEIFTALKTFEYNEEEVLLCLTKSEFICQVRNQIAFSRKDFVKNPSMLAVSIPASVMSNAASDDDLSSESEEDLKVNYKESNNKRKKQLTNSKQKKLTRLKLDEALAGVNISGIMDGWSEARVRAYQGMKKNPNAYYYRFNEPGEKQKNGPWSEEEEEMFMKRLSECGADGQWGIFSKPIPGRVGYQCSNYYRKLIENGKIRDTNYQLDEKGKAHFIGGKTRASVKSYDNENESASGSEEFDGSCDEEDVDADMAAFSNANNNAYANNNTYNTGLYHENPLPGFIDAITKTPVTRPAISPYGHVLSYDTWIKCLLNGDRKNTCPLTNQPLHKRQLIFLTFENIEMYRDEIRKINGI